MKEETTRLAVFDKSTEKSFVNKNKLKNELTLTEEELDFITKSFKANVSVHKKTFRVFEHWAFQDFEKFFETNKIK